jgi:hypothetical protein
MELPDRDAQIHIDANEKDGIKKDALEETSIDPIHLIGDRGLRVKLVSIGSAQKKLLWDFFLIVLSNIFISHIY